MTTSSVVSTLILADVLELKVLKTAAMKFLVNNFKNVVVNLENFHLLSHELIHEAFMLTTITPDQLNDCACLRTKSRGGW